MNAILSAASIPAWEPQPDVWLLITLLGAGYWAAVVRLGPLLAPDPTRPVTRKQVVAYALGVVTVWVASDWPVHIIAERSLYSVHMIQHLVLAIVAVPLILMGTPAWLARWILSPMWLMKTVRFGARFLPGVIIYNTVLVVTHWPAFVDLTLRNGLVHFAAHSILFVSSIVVWLPILSPLPEVPRLAPPVRMLYLFTQSILPTLPATFLTFGSRPLYRFYEEVEQLFGFSALEDQRTAGLIMKIVAGTVIWGVIGAVFFRWASDEEKHEPVPGPRFSAPTIAEGAAAMEPK